MRPTEVWLARHGGTEWTASRRHTGGTDIPLTEAGREQARRLGERLAGERFDLVLSSPSSRAMETARLAGFEPRIDPRLREWDYGDYEGRTTDEIHAGRPGWYLWTDGCPGGESVAEVDRRLEPLATELRGRDGGPALLFGHGHCLRALAGCWLDLGAAGGRHLQLATASVSVLSSEHGRPSVLRWNLAP